MSRTQNEIGDLVNSLFNSNTVFKPIAVYNKDLDTIHVYTEDCSVTEVRQYGTPLGLLRRNHETRGKVTHVGFMIEGVQYLSRAYNLPTVGEVSIKNILEKMCAEYPRITPAVLDIAIPLLNQHQILTVHL